MARRVSNSVTVIIPVGPGHEELGKQAARSVREAWKHSHGPFTSMKLVLVDDGEGDLGRSAARNKGLDENPAKWHFLLDADDRMMLPAFTLIDQDATATFGAVCLDRRVLRENVYPVNHDILRRFGARKTICMGFFVRGDLGLRFDESLDVGEDFDFYMRLPDMVKVRDPLVSIGYKQPSASGPRGRGGKKIQWTEVCDEIIARYPALAETR